MMQIAYKRVASCCMAFVSLQRFGGLVKLTNKIKLELQPFETIAFSGLVRKQMVIDSAVSEQTEKTSNKIGVCPRVVAMDKPGKNARVSVCVFNISARS